MQKQEAFDDGGPNAAANVSENQDAAADDEQEMSLFKQQQQAHPDHQGNVPLPAGMAQQKLDRSTRAQLWAQYQRSLNPSNAQMSSRTDKCPDHIREEVFNSMEAKQFYFQVWLNQPKPT
jgi:hypothetical protein